MLDARSRWLLLVELLLGNAPVRGGRTRDFPFSLQRVQGSVIARCLQTCEEGFSPGQEGKRGRYSFYDLLVALQCIEAATSPVMDLEAEQHFTTALRVLVELLLSEIYQRPLLDMLGISGTGADGALKLRKKYQRDVLVKAQTLAVLARTDIPPAEMANILPYLKLTYGLRDRTVKELAKAQLALVYLKTKGAQSFIDRCYSPFLQRGASFWCSQTSARARDSLKEFGQSNIGLLLDNDAITVLTCSIPAAGTNSLLNDLARLVSQQLFDDNSLDHVSRSFLRRHYPRLMPYFERALQAEVATSNCIPAMGLQVRLKSVLDLAIDRTLQDEPSVADIIGERIVRGTEARTFPQNTSECSGRQGDVRLPGDVSVPSWYTPGRDEGYGFPSIVFSLAELTYSKAAGGSIAGLIKERHGLTLQPAFTQRELLKGAGVNDDRLTYLKYDGDGVGKMFSSIPTLRRPSVSLALENLMRDSWLDAIATLANRRSISGNPVDLLYFGGDDLLMALPTELLGDFLDIFDKELIKAGTQEIGLTFTFAAISHRVKQVNHRKEKQDSSWHASILGQINALLAEAKSFRRSGCSGPTLRPGSRLLTYTTTCGLVFDIAE